MSDSRDASLQCLLVRIGEVIETCYPTARRCAVVVTHEAEDDPKTVLNVFTRPVAPPLSVVARG